MSANQFRRHDSGRDRGPDGRASEPGARCSRGCAGRRSGSCWSTTGGARTRRCPCRRASAWSGPARPGRGPAAARNAGWRACRADWVAFLDDDVEPAAGWLDALAADLAAAGPDVGGVQGRVVVPLPPDRRPTDWERNTRGLERARWATADLAYRRAALEAAGGFDERFPRAYREDADLGLRVTAARRADRHRRARGPAPGAPRAGVGVGGQAGRQRRRRADAGAARPRLAGPRRACRRAAARGISRSPPPARWPWRRSPPRRPRVGAVAGAAWLAGTAELAWARIAPGPRTPREVATMLWTSAAIPFAASGWWLAGHATLRRRLRAPRSQSARIKGSDPLSGRDSRGLTPSVGRAAGRAVRPRRDARGRRALQRRSRRGSRRCRAPRPRWPACGRPACRRR